MSNPKPPAGARGPLAPKSAHALDLSPWPNARNALAYVADELRRQAPAAEATKPGLGNAMEEKASWLGFLAREAAPLVTTANPLHAAMFAGICTDFDLRQRLRALADLVDAEIAKADA